MAARLGFEPATLRT